MATAYVMDFETGDSAAYDAVMEEMDLRGELPQGALFHGAGPTDTGWRVIDVWDDADAFDRFAAEKLVPITPKHGFAPPQMQVLEVAELRRGDDEPVAFVQFVKIPG